MAPAQRGKSRLYQAVELLFEAADDVVEDLAKVEAHKVGQSLAVEGVAGQPPADVPVQTKSICLQSFTMTEFFTDAAQNFFRSSFTRGLPRRRRQPSVFGSVRPSTWMRRMNSWRTCLCWVPDPRRQRTPQSTPTQAHSTPCWPEAKRKEPPEHLHPLRLHGRSMLAFRFWGTDTQPSSYEWSATWKASIQRQPKNGFFFALTPVCPDMRACRLTCLRQILLCRLGRGCL